MFLLSGDTEIFNSTPAGTTIGLQSFREMGKRSFLAREESFQHLNERECGHMGVTMTAGTLGWIMLAPAATAYAVLPVGVDTISPSPCSTSSDERGNRVGDQFLPELR